MKCVDNGKPTYQNVSDLKNIINTVICVSHDLLNNMSTFSLIATDDKLSESEDNLSTWGVFFKSAQIIYLIFKLINYLTKSLSCYPLWEI